MNFRKLIVSGTGHRPDKLGGYTDKAFNKLVLVASDWLLVYKPDLVISGLAMGWDMALAQACVNLGIPYLCAIPFKGQERLWPQQTKDLYNFLISKASEVVIVSAGDYTAKKMQIRNEYMVNKSNLILSMWDGSTGGTANCLRYAEKKGKKIVNLYEKYLAVS